MINSLVSIFLFKNESVSLKEASSAASFCRENNICELKAQIHNENSDKIFFEHFEFYLDHEELVAAGAKLKKELSQNAPGLWITIEEKKSSSKILSVLGLGVSKRNSQIVLHVIISKGMTRYVTNLDTPSANYFIENFLDVALLSEHPKEYFSTLEIF